MYYFEMLNTFINLNLLGILFEMIFEMLKYSTVHDGHFLPSSTEMVLIYRNISAPKLFGFFAVLGTKVSLGIKS